MRANLGAFLKNTDRQLAFLLLRKLRKSDTRGQSRRASAYDDHIKIHCFSFHNISRFNKR